MFPRLSDGGDMSPRGKNLQSQLPQLGTIAAQRSGEWKRLDRFSVYDDAGRMRTWSLAPTWRERGL